MNGLDLFSGIGGMSLALRRYVRPVCYVESDPFCQALLQERMLEGDLPEAPVWDDVRTFDGKPWRGVVDCVSGGFPCQDISVAGHGAGLEGKRSGLFFEALRIIDECEPRFLFFENVPAIRTRGLATVGTELAGRGYDLRWTTLSAAAVGAPHLRKRWFCLAAHADHCLLRNMPRRRGGQNGHGASVSLVDGSHGKMADTSRGGREQGPKDTAGRDVRSRQEGRASRPSDSGALVADADVPRLEVREGVGGNARKKFAAFERADWWATEPDLGRVADGIPARVDKLRALGNAVVPLQARTAFEHLAGLCA